MNRFNMSKYHEDPDDMFYHGKNITGNNVVILVKKGIWYCRDCKKPMDMKVAEETDHHCGKCKK